jgi:hypothetical protein
MQSNVIPLTPSSRVELDKLYLDLLNAVLGEHASAATEAVAKQLSTPETYCHPAAAANLRNSAHVRLSLDAPGNDEHGVIIGLRELTFVRGR